MKVILRHAAHVRTGDKGNISNVGVFAYADELYPILKEQLTADKFREFYQGVILGSVARYEVDSICGLNFVGQNALGGGVSRGLRLDPYGKSLSSAILAFELDVPERLRNHLRGL